MIYNSNSSSVEDGSEGNPERKLVIYCCLPESFMEKILAGQQYERSDLMSERMVLQLLRELDI